MDPAKIEAVVKWRRLNIVLEIMSVLGLAGYYHQFVKRFSSIAAPLTRLTKKNVKFEWDGDCKNNFQELKRKLTTTLILVISSGEEGYAVYSDAYYIGLVVY